MFTSSAALGCAGDDPIDRTLFRDDVSFTDSEARPDVGFGDDAESDKADEGETDMSLPDTGEPGDGFCEPNGDGIIERAEVPLRVGLNAKFRVATDVTFDTRGTMEGGERVWDLAREFAGDELTIVELAPLEGRWFASEFPGADYATRLSVDEDLLGVFEIADEALFLQGIVSPDEGFTQTELTYDPPVATLEFPIDENSTWQTDAEVSGTALGVVVFYDESYVYTPAGTGILKTPFGDFDVLRIRVDLERVQGFVTTTIRTYIFVSECFGTVATVRSNDNESDVEFIEAAEIRRLAP